MSKISNYQIRDIRSFEETTADPRQIAALYFYQTLDCLIDLTYAVAVDFRKRPQLYRELGQASQHQSIAEILGRFNAQYGTEITVLSGIQRRDIYVPIFGDSQDDSFSRLRQDLIAAAKAFAERSAESGIEMLRESVRSAHRPFKDYLLGLHGDSVRFHQRVLFEQTEKVCYPVLRSEAIGAVFGIAKRSAAEYPYQTDPAEDLLVEGISSQLSAGDGAKWYLTREKISNLQRAALRGTEAIATAIDYQEAESGQTDVDLDLLISKCYTWGSCLSSLKPQPTMSATQTIQPRTTLSITAPSTRASFAPLRPAASAALPRR